MLINPLKKENRAYSTFCRRAKIERNVYFVIATVLFILSSFLTFEFLYEGANILASIISNTPNEAIRQFTRMVPIFVLTIAMVHLNIALRCIYKAHTQQSRFNGLRHNSRVTFCFGAFIVIYVIIGLVSGMYSSAIEGYPSLLYPLDMLFVGCLLMGIKVAECFYEDYIKKHPIELPLYDDKRNPHLRRVDHVFYSISYIIALISFASNIYSFFVMDFTHGNIFFNVMMILVQLLAWLTPMFYIFVYDEAKPELKNKIQSQYSLIIFAINLLVWILYLIANQLQPHAPNLNAFGLLPIEYTASINAFWIIYLLNNVGGTLSSTLKALVRHLKERKIEK